MGHVPGSFRGLFVGIDTYLSDDIHQLRTARWDAEVMHALFTDNHAGGSFALVVDESATRSRLIAELEALRATCRPDDTVVIMFSGHGSTTHDLVTHDADLVDLPGTALPLAEFLDYVRSLPARHAVVLLDCCFSGGAGAKAVAPPATVAGTSVAPELDVAGVHVVAACGADEAAYEDRRAGHSLFTGQVISALLGRAEVTQRNAVPLRQLFAVVCRQVANRADLLGLVQHPAVSGTSDQDPIWPAMTAGPRYRALVGEAERSPVTTDLTSLRRHGLTDAVLDVWRQRIGTLNGLQCAAVNRGGVLSQQSLVVMAPTAAGKTMVGEMAAVHSALCHGRAVFLVPTRALVNELHTRFTEMYGNVGIRVVRATGQLSSDIPAIVRGRYTLAVLTYETYAGLVQAHPGLIEQITTLVVDEVQAIADPERGTALELFLTSVLSLPAKRRPQIVALSAGLGEDHSHLDTWLEATPLLWPDRPVPLVEGTLTPDGTFHCRTDAGMEADEQLVVRPKYEPDFDAVMEVIRQETRRGGQVIVFRRTRPAAVAEAERLGDQLGLPRATSTLADLPREDDTRARTALAACLRHGVAFHTADLGDEARRVVENAFRAPNSEIRVLVCTTSLAQGVNFPADLVVVRDLGDQRGPARWDCTVAEYKNMAGRAGRTSLGRAVVPVRMGDPDGVFESHVRGVPERVRSSLLDEPDLESLVLRAFAVVRGRRLQVRSPDLRDFLDCSLAAHQSRADGGRFPLTRRDVWDAVESLRGVGLLQLDGEELRLTSLGEVVSSGTLRVSSAVAIGRLLRELAPEDVTGELLLVVAQCTDELDAVAVDGTVTWRNSVTYFAEQGFPQPVTNTVVNSPRSFDRAARALICLKWVRLVSMTEIEAKLADRRATRIVPINPVLSRTRDVIDSIVRLALELQPSTNRAELVQLPIQLDHGVPAAFAELAIRAGRAVDRWNYRCLWRHGLRDLESMLDVDPAVLAAALGDDTRKAATVRQFADDVVTFRQA